MGVNVIYLYRSAGMGDVLWTEPLLRDLAVRNKKLVLYTGFPEIFKNYPLQNVKIKKLPPGWRKTWLKVKGFFLGKRIFHKLDGVYESTPKMHMLHAYQQYFSLPQTNVYPSLYLSEEEKKPIEGFPVNHVVLHLDANAPFNYRKIYGVDWQEIINFLGAKGYPVILVGNNPSVFKGATVFEGSIRQLIQLINQCRFFIGVDSGPSHIAASLKIPSLVFFGSVNPRFRHFPEIFKGFFIQQACEFAGCYHEVIGGSGQTCQLVGDAGIPKCCLNSTEEVKAFIERLIERYHLPNS